MTQTIADGESGIVVLRDGGVLAGQITRAADWYVVSRAGGQMQIAQSRVMLVCRSIEEAYEFRRQQLSGEDIVARLSLAEWCVRNNLLDQAERELADASQLDPDHPRLALLVRRLQTIKTAPTAKSNTAPVVKAQPRATKPAPPEPVMAGDLPEGVVERFTRKVQPILVNNCTTSACHQPGGAQAFQLDRALLRGEANRRTTMQNLKAALALVDRNQPEQSPLLTIPRQAHGGMAGPIFGPRHAQAYKHLADWVALIVPPPPAAAASIDEPANADEKIAAEMPAENGNAVPAIAPVRPANQTEAIPHKPNRRPLPVRRAAVNEDEQPLTLRPPHPLRYGARLESWQPRDPFDPEIFNRMQRARTPAASAPTPATAPDNR